MCDPKSHEKSCWKRASKDGHDQIARHEVLGRHRELAARSTGAGPAPGLSHSPVRGRVARAVHARDPHRVICVATSTAKCASRFCSSREKHSVRQLGHGLRVAPPPPRDGTSRSSRRPSDRAPRRRGSSEDPVVAGPARGTAPATHTARTGPTPSRRVARGHSSSLAEQSAPASAPSDAAGGRRSNRGRPAASRRKTGAPRPARARRPAARGHGEPRHQSSRARGASAGRRACCAAASAAVAASRARTARLGVRGRSGGGSGADALSRRRAPLLRRRARERGGRRLQSARPRRSGAAPSARGGVRGCGRVRAETVAHAVRTLSEGTAREMRQQRAGPRPAPFVGHEGLEVRRHGRVD